MAAMKYDYPEGLTTCDHLAHDIKQGRFPERSSIDQFICERGNDSLIQPDLVPMLLDVSIDPCDGSIHPSLQYVLIRGFSAMGWAQPSAAAEDMAMEILKMIRPSIKPHPMDEGLRRTQETMTRMSQRLDNLNPDEEIGCFDGSGRWIALMTVREARTA